MFDDSIIMEAAQAERVVWVDRDRRLWMAKGKRLDVLCIDNGNGYASLVATQPASVDGEPMPEVMAFVSQLLSLQDVAEEE